MKRLGRLLVAFAVGAACFYGPFTHIHSPGQAESHVATEHVSAGIAFHIHLGARSDQDPTWSAADESARPLEWFRFNKSQKMPTAPPPARGLAAAPDLRAERLVASDIAAQDARGSSPPLERGPPQIG